MSQYGIIFETDLTKEELQQSLHEDGVLKHLSNYGAFPHVVSMAPVPVEATTTSRQRRTPPAGV